MYNRRNFHKHTFSIFEQVPDSKLNGFTADYKSKSGSEYYFTDEGVFRRSNHWGRAANCKWRLQGRAEGLGRTKTGFARWTDFHRDNDTERLYFIIRDGEHEVSFQHKSNMPEGYIAQLRNASETTKVVKQIRTLIKNDDWAKHFDIDINELRSRIISQLIHSDSDLRDIKSGLLPK